MNGNYSAEYTYDAVGNRTYQIIDGVHTALSYDDNDRLTQMGGEHYSYDANGNTLSKTIDGDVVSYGYNAKNQLVSMGNNTTIGSASYVYNTDGIRIQKTEDGQQTRFLIDANRVYAQVVTETTPTAETNYTFGDDLVSQSRNAITSYYLYDGLGSTRALTDDAGTVTDTYNYEAFGDALNKTGTTENNYLYTGEQYDSNLDNYYLRARYYDPTSARFTQQDTWMGNSSDPITLHKYLYANANPVNMIDPTGNFSLASAGSAITVVSNLAASFSVGYDLASMLYGNGDPLVSIEEANVQQISFAIIGSAGAGKIAKILSKNKRLKKLFKTRKLLRGVNNNSVGYSDAVRGYVAGSYFDFMRPSTYSQDTAALHNNGKTYGTMFSSWTTKRRIAKHFATFETRWKRSHGVIITAKVMSFRIFKSPNKHNIAGLGSEGEWLVVGPVQGIPTPVK